MRAFAILFTAWLAAGCGLVDARPRTAVLGFWFEPVSFASPVLNGALGADDLAVIERVARAEITTAFDGLRVTLSDRRDARYRISVVQDLIDFRTERKMSVAGEARGSRLFGGTGSVNFSYFASGALVFAPDAAGRGELVEAIGRGIGRSAVHEFTHLLLPDREIDALDRASYEYHTAARLEQYYGAIRWDAAHRLLVDRYGIP